MRKDIMSLSEEEKGLLGEAVQVYLQIASRQMPQEHIEQIAKVAQSALSKLDSIGSSEPGGNKPLGITDEWFENVCKSCDKLSPSGCSDKVTEKFPGKCDPILHFEKKKILEGNK